MARLPGGLTGPELDSLARLSGRDAEALGAELSRKPWTLFDLLNDAEVVDAVLDPTPMVDTSSPFALFAVLVRRAADELLCGTYVNDWIGPRRRLPVFDIEPLQEFVAAPGRVLFVTRLLTSMVAPVGVPPIRSLNPWELIECLDAVDDGARIVLLRRVGDLALFRAGVLADSCGGEVVSASAAATAGELLGMTSDKALALTDRGSIHPGLDALEELGAQSYREMQRADSSTPPIVADIAQRMHTARRFLTHVADRYLAPLDPALGFAA